MKKSKSLIAVTAIGALAAVGLAAAAPASGAVSHRQIPRSKPTWVSSTKSLGRAASNGTASFRVYLAPHGGLAALKAEVDRLSNPSSSSYAHWLSASQYHAKYDATSAEAGQVTSWLKSQHLTVASVEAHRRYVSVTGTNAATAKAFGTTLNRYQHHGQTVVANASALSVPSSIASLVTTVTGLDTTPRIIRHKTTFPAGFRNARPCSSYYGEKTADKKADGTALPKFNGHYLPYAVCGYTGKQLRPAYEGTSTATGANVTVAITDAYASPTMASDAQRYAVDNGDKPYVKGQYREVLPKSYTRKQTCGATGWWGEESLDVESVHAMAPDANILYYGSASCFDKDFLNTLTRVVDDNVASLVTNSWSDLEANESPSTTAAYQQIFLQGATQGIGFMFSSGDDGDELDATGTKQANYPASDPYATAVGGTSDAIGSTGQFLFQTGWGTHKYSLSDDSLTWNPLGFWYGAGGGYSSLFPKPYYQAAAVPDSTTTMRAVPDVGLDSDPTTGFLVGQTQAFPEGDHYDVYRIGGTSLGSPLMAGLTALTTQNAQHRLGFLNPLIYKNQNSGAFADINGNPGDAGNVRPDFANSLDATGGILYSVRTFNEDSSLATGPGWDDVTGVGSPHSGWTTAQ